MNKLKERIKKGERLCGAIVSLTDPCLCEIFGNVGFDYIWIDMEHTYTSYKEVLCHLNAARSTGTPAIIRVPQNDLTATKKILEMDPDGIIFPMVRTAEEAKALIDMTLYPPRGSVRGPWTTPRSRFSTATAGTQCSSIAPKPSSLCAFTRPRSICSSAPTSLRWESKMVNWLFWAK